MSGQNGFPSKAFSVFMDMDKMVGSDFEAGLITSTRDARREAPRLESGCTDVRDSSRTPFTR
ncbi:hypothetical protein COCOR_05975 [Corallococcus coralloides DSM 2259]|uniref:Uncharacterized protein n=1 Tax=Corallococcus coralloides (strain ATCC 25202 / DSM 2259 / NBRC 100086 / M2) TaxID=1144275 RepID=H8MJP1_CORCM|nr:hypothetical protein COCOR_05975 [Corallococcus coralloides DSM 2259]